ncbi:MAG: alternate F1F0 ATPase, F1 subunit alpha [Geminicoccales bacterium]
MTAKGAGLQDTLTSIGQEIGRQLHDHHPGLKMNEIGRVVRVSAAITEVEGFTDVTDNELIRFPNGLVGIAANLDESGIGVMLLGRSDRLRIGDQVERTRRAVDVPIGDALLGRIVDPTGRPLDRGGAINTTRRAPVERAAPSIISRGPVATPLQTGIKAIDAAIPIGRGQRELILGDRQTGKTSIAIDTLLNQQADDVIAIYCAIGQRGASVARVIGDLRAHGAIERCIVVVAGGDDPPGLQFIAPYAATTMAEFFMERGQDVLIIYDDLTRHARAYRELSLLLRRPPGREAYPGDIFFIHARLLERATRLRDDHGGGSMTALPILETQAQNIAAYIPTNLISITDGQIYLSPELFRKGQLPAIDIGKSVSRVGGRAQLPAYRAVAGELRLSYAQFEELETFARLGTRLDDATRGRLERGRRVREILKQNEHDLLTVLEQIVVILAVTEGLFDQVPVDEVTTAADGLRQVVIAQLSDIGSRLEAGASLGSTEREAILEAARSYLSNGIA